MYQIDWANHGLWQQEEHVTPGSETHLKRDAVSKVMLLHWQEHCLECSPPQCYSSCSLFVARSDQKCARFVYGIAANRSFKGLLDFGADIRFRRWAKLETRFYGPVLEPSQISRISRYDRVLTSSVGAASSALVQLSPHRRLNGAFALLREKTFKALPSEPSEGGLDRFVLECFSPEKESFRLILEHWNGEVKLRHAFTIEPGTNYQEIPGERFAAGPLAGKLSLYPENNLECRLIFTWLDFVQFKENAKPSIPVSVPSSRQPSAKVKCVVWDLDNTLWTGILTEDTESKIQLRDDAVDLVKELDRRGIVQSIVSKNHLDEAWGVISRMGLADYFLHPQINWDPKSTNIARIAAALNINLDTLALIDDSPFEREEVQSVHPQVRVFSEDKLASLLSRPEFDLPITELSSKRRLSYLTEIKREQEREAFSDYEAFLRSCNMTLHIFVPVEASQQLRCLELIQRANQLNLSTRRYAEPEFKRLMETPGMLCLAMECSDKFGAYGIVGFAAVDERSDPPVLLDMVLSCRVAQKRVEQSFLEWLALREIQRGMRTLRADLVKTERNTPMLQVFQSLPFRVSEERNGHTVMDWTLDENIALSNILTLESEVDLAGAGTQQRPGR
ncbi:MAG: HAD-IIIC family phosphatase [Bryobacteraceae bacterium]